MFNLISFFLCFGFYCGDTRKGRCGGGCVKVLRRRRRSRRW